MRNDNFFDTTQVALAKFVASKTAQNCSPETIKTYSVHIEAFLRFLDIDGVKPIYELCRPEAYENYINYLLTQKKIKPVTAHSYASSIKVFLNWCFKRYPFEKFEIKLPKFQRKILDTYSDEQLRILLERPDSDCAETEFMTWVIVNVFAYTGMRLNSLRNLLVDDVIFKDSKIKVNVTKNMLPLLIPPAETLFVILREYISRFELIGTDYLFCTAYHTQYAKRTIEKYVEIYERNRGIDIPRRCHTFRHTFAKKYYEKTHDVLAVKNVLGHSGLDETLRYLDDLGFKIEERINFDPRDDLGIEDNLEIRKRRRKKMNEMI